jgi:hypothetical protein
MKDRVCGRDLGCVRKISKEAGWEVGYELGYKNGLKFGFECGHLNLKSDIEKLVLDGLSYEEACKTLLV